MKKQLDSFSRINSKQRMVKKNNDIQLVTITEKEVIEAFEKLDDEKANV